MTAWFLLAVSLNYLPFALGGTAIELGLLAVLHLVVIFRIHQARKSAAGQRAADLERFLSLR